MTELDVVEFTNRYEDWLGEHIPLVRADLSAKHTEMADSVLRFLRGTYYLWLRRIVDLLPELLERPAVPLVGDLHIENFGTWRDRDRVRRWGVNDLDELARGPYPLDLLRLATSAALVPGLPLPNGSVCRLLLEHWRRAAPGPAADIDAESHRHLRSLVPVADHAERFYRRLEAGEPLDATGIPEPVRVAVATSAPEGWRPGWYARRAGTGSLGHPRAVAVGRDGAGDWHAREVKLLGPATIGWPPARGRAAVRWPAVDDGLYTSVTGALHGPYPGHRVQGWQLRRLAPDVVRIELAGLAGRDTERVVRSMAQAIVDVHGADPGALAAARADEAERPGRWLRDATEAMVSDTRACHRRWRHG